MWCIIPFETVPAGILPGHLTAAGTLHPPSQFVFFSPRNGVIAPSGQVFADRHTHPAEPADDVMIAKCVDGLIHASPFNQDSQTRIDNPLSDLRDAVREDSKAHEEVRDDKQLAGVREWNWFAVADRRDCDDRQIERLDPVGTDDNPKSDRSAQSQQAQ